MKCCEKNISLLLLLLSFSLGNIGAQPAFKLYLKNGSQFQIDSLFAAQTGELTAIYNEQEVRIDASAIDTLVPLSPSKDANGFNIRFFGITDFTLLFNQVPEAPGGRGRMAVGLRMNKKFGVGVYMSPTYLNLPQERYRWVDYGVLLSHLFMDSPTWSMEGIMSYGTTINPNKASSLQFEIGLGAGRKLTNRLAIVGQVGYYSGTVDRDKLVFQDYFVGSAALDPLGSLNRNIRWKGIRSSIGLRFN